MILLNKCPVCGGKLYTDRLMQYGIIHQIGKSGKETHSSYKKSNDGPLDCMAIYCENHDFGTDYDLIIEKPQQLKDMKVFQKNEKFYIDEEKI